MYCDLNLYELNLIFDKVYKSKLFVDENDTIAKLKQKAYKNDGILINNQEVLSYIKKDESYETVSFNSLDDYLQTQLMQLFLKKEKKLYSNLSKFVPDKSFSKYEIKRNIIGNILKLNNKFYISLDIQQTIIPKITLYDELRVHLKSDLINKEVRPIGNNSIGIVEKIIFPDDDEYNSELEKIINYFKQQNRQIKIKKEPIIGICFKNNNNNIIYSYFASDLKLYYSPKDINTSLVISNIERKNLIKNAIKKSNISCIDTKLYRKKFYRFYPIKFIGFKQVNDIKKLLVRIDNNVTTIFPKRIPPILRKENKIKVLIFIDSSIKTINTPYINMLYQGLKAISKQTNIQFELVNKNDYFINEFTAQNIVKKALSYKNEEIIPPLIITIGTEKNLSYYEDMKRKLFKYGFITQNIIYEHILSSKIYEINNLILQILVKYGMYPYIISTNHPYDYILGIDVGNDKYGNRNTAGGISVINKNGILEKLIPVKIHTNGEKVDLSMFLEELSVYLPLKDKKILILRDGKLTKNEKESILKEFNNLNINSITFMNVVKRHSLRIYDDCEGKKGVILKNNLALLLAHEIKGARAIKIDVKTIIENGNMRDESITDKDLELLFNLTNLNYSNIFLFSKRLRLPAPIHYSDKFVKALGKEWKIKEDLLLNGFLYFL